MTPDSFRPDRQPWVMPGQIELHVGDMTASFSADVRLRDAQAALSEIGQFLPIDGNPDSSLGQLIERNSTGPLRLGYGAWRDLLLGVQFENGLGQLITAGGRVVKNVAGYDLTKFMVGSAGIFGRIKALTLRAWRRPAGALRVVHPPDARIVGTLMPGPLKPQWALMTGDALTLGYLGDEPTLNYYRGHIRDSEPREVIDQTVADDMAWRAQAWQAAGEMTFRASIPPARLNGLLAAMPSDPWIADAAFGIVIGPANDRSAIEGAISSLGGSVQFWKPAEARGALIDVSTNPIERQIIERLKAAFDPGNKLDPLPWAIR